MPVPMVALKKMTYAGKTYTQGNPFDARDEADAVVLRLTKLAVDAPPQSATPDPEPVHPDHSDPSPLPPPVFASDHSYRAEVSETPPIEQEPQESPAVSDQEDVTDDVTDTASNLSEETPRKRRTYKRKDLTAEGQ